MDRYVCVHGHFYQPPRENPWLEVVELQDSAYPYHDWNQRITAESYGPNARSRILDGENRIVRIANNYSRMSFNFGPTLLKWLEDEALSVYESILEADRESMGRFSGHGSALAQCWGHMIMPLANSRDKYTQVLWGVRDFEHRFGRRPEGMWLPETAVDLETLDIMAQLGVRFTILEPHQAARVRGIGARPWNDMRDGGIDPTRAYSARLSSGRRMNLFFYDGPISRSVAFEGLLSSGEQFANRLASGFSDQRSWPQLVNIATDGESYGHHHRHGDMALAYALEHIENAGIAKLTNYGEYLERHPATHDVEIFENTSWSCPHGVERWRSDCGCSTGGHPDWNQAWRQPLRDALDWLRDQAAPSYEEKAGDLLQDPWAARDDYIDVILDRRPENTERFFTKHSARPLDGGERMAALKLLELQRHALLMYTGCGWFFDELSGIETTQVMQYAGRVIQLARELFGAELEEGFLQRLELAPSNVPENQNGRAVYEQIVKPAMVDLPKIAAHFAVSSLFQDDPEEARVFCHSADVQDYQLMEAGQARLAVGRVGLTSIITGESDVLSFGVLHMGDHNITAGVHRFEGPESYDQMVAEASQAFSRAELPEVIRLLDRHFGELTYSLKSLFKDEQRKVLDVILGSALAEAEASYGQIFEHHAQLMRFLSDIGTPLPSSFLTAAQLVINGNLRRALEDEPMDPERVRSLLAEAGFWVVDLDSVALAFVAEKTLDHLAEQFVTEPQERVRLEQLEAAVAAAKDLPFPVDLSEAQNCYYNVLQGSYQGMRERANAGDDAARAWMEHFLALGVSLAVRVE